MSAGRSAQIPPSSPEEAVPGIRCSDLPAGRHYLCLELGDRQETPPGFCNALQPT